MLLTEEQAAALNAAQSGCNIAIEARAGAGKTTTLREIAAWATRAGKRALYLTFSRRLAAEAEAKMPPNVEVRTNHAVGLQVYRMNAAAWGLKQPYYRLSPAKKYFFLAKEMVLEVANKPGSPLRSYADRPGAAAYALARTFEVCATTLLPLAVQQEDGRPAPNVDGILRLADRLGTMDFVPAGQRPALARLVPRLALAGWDACKKGNVGFIDHLYAAYAAERRGLPVSFPRYDLVLGDEIQDWSPLILWLTRRLVGDAQFVGVGDPKQAIFAWAGADARAFANVVKEFQATVLPLTETFRCPAEHLALQGVADWVPDIRTRKTGGTVEWQKYDQALAGMKPGDGVLCRKTAPLVRSALTLIAQGRSAVVLGRDIAEQLLNVLLRALGIEETADDSAYVRLSSLALSEALDALDRLVEREESAMGNNPSPFRQARFADLLDQIGAIRAIIEAEQAKGAQTVGAVRARLHQLFDDEVNGRCIVLCTVHKAKGREWETVYVLERDKMPAVRKGLPAELVEQERNLLYVALTRSERTLFLVRSESEE